MTTEARRYPIHSEGLLLEGRLIVPEGAPLLVLLCHGIPSGRPPAPDDEGYAGLAWDLAGAGFAASWFDFRGAHGSPGDFSIDGWAADLEAALDAIAGHPATGGLPVVVAGSSAGGSVAVCVAARRTDVRAVATLAAPAEFRLDDIGGPETAAQRFRNIGIIRDPAFPRDLETWWAGFAAHRAERFAGSIAPRPLLIVHGDADDVVPYAHAERLLQAAGEPAELVRLPGGAHQLRRDPRTLDVLVDWLSSLRL